MKMKPYAIWMLDEYGKWGAENVETEEEARERVSDYNSHSLRGEFYFWQKEEYTTWKSVESEDLTKICVFCDEENNVYNKDCFNCGRESFVSLLFNT
jgi:hypothetical protein